jgi:putative transposase
MSRTGDCWESVVAESFFSTLEYECIEGHIFNNVSHVHHVDFEYIEGFYNPERLHSTVGYGSPIECELAFNSRRDAA